MKKLALGLTLIIACSASAAAAGKYWFHCQNETWKQTFDNRKDCVQARDEHKRDYVGHEASPCRND